VADGGGARPESARERGLPVAGGVVQVRGAVGKLGRSRGGVGEEWERGNEWSSASGERAARR
jgi:hypothetical protein